MGLDKYYLEYAYFLQNYLHPMLVAAISLHHHLTFNHGVQVDGCYVGSTGHYSPLQPLVDWATWGMYPVYGLTRKYT